MKSMIRSALALVVLCGLAACSTPPTPTPAQRPVPGAATTPWQDLPSALTAEHAQGVTVYALGLVGTPYRYGGNTPESGFDCSGLIGHVYAQQAGIAPPRTVAGLKTWGQAVPQEQLRTGDLVVFFQGAGTSATHAGIYVGEGRFVHAPSTGGRVRMDHITSPYWARQAVAYRRP
jgi:cell wall-associated NlpC family hydrolase